MPFLKTYFNNQELIILGIALLFHIVSVYFFSIKKQTTKALIFLLIGALILRVLMILFDSFLHPWDEQVHALVAKNMAENPFLPILYKEAFLGYDPNNWTQNYVWVHKQPLFLWQMALSIKIFGNSILAVRLPSLIMSTLLIPLIYRVGKLVFNKDVGYLACIIYATNNYLLDFITGYYNTDHNDIAFIFYVGLSFWTYTEYIYSNNKRYLYLIGFSAGLAILNKWLVGLLVFSGWGVGVFFISGIKNKFNELKSIGISFLICLITFIPWQIYLWINFKDEYEYEMSKSSEHFFQVVEGHSGEWWYYFSQSIEQYGVVLACLIPIALILFVKQVENKKVKISFITYIVITVVFFTIAKTKMPAFCLIIAPLIFIVLANVIYNVQNYTLRMPSGKYLYFSIIIILIIFNINVEKIQAHHTDQKIDRTAWYRLEKIKGFHLANQLKKDFREKNIVFFNCDDIEYIQIMFFSDFLAYTRIPSQEELKIIKEKGFSPVVLRDEKLLPEYIFKDESILIYNNITKPKGEAKRYRVKVATGDYIYSDAGENNQLKTKANLPLKEGVFKIYIYENNQIVIENNKRQVWGAKLGSDQKVNVDNWSIGAWEVFEIEIIDATHFAIKANNGKYLSLYKGEIIVNADFIGKNEIFEKQLYFH